MSPTAARTQITERTTAGDGEGVIPASRTSTPRSLQAQPDRQGWSDGRPAYRTIPAWPGQWQDCKSACIRLRPPGAFRERFDSPSSSYRSRMPEQRQPLIRSWALTIVRPAGGDSRDAQRGDTPQRLPRERLSQETSPRCLKKCPRDPRQGLGSFEGHRNVGGPRDCGY